MNIGALITLLKLFEGSGLTNKTPPSKPTWLTKRKPSPGEISPGGSTRDLGLLRYFK